MATNTTNYGFKKPDESDFYDVADQNKNWDLADEALKNLDTPTFEDYTGSTAVPSATDAIDQIKSKGKLGTLLSNIKAAFKGACLIGHIVNNCVTDNAGLPLSAAQGKVLKDLYTQLYSDSQALSTKVADCASKTVDNGYSGRNLYYTSTNIEKDSWTKAPILISSKNPNNGQRAQIGFENQGANAGVLWLDVSGELHFTDQAGTDHVISWKG